VRWLLRIRCGCLAHRDSVKLTCQLGRLDRDHVQGNYGIGLQGAARVAYGQARIGEGGREEQLQLYDSVSVRSRPCWRAGLTGIHLYRVRSCQEILRRNGRCGGQRYPGRITGRGALEVRGAAALPTVGLARSCGPLVRTAQTSYIICPRPLTPVSACFCLFSQAPPSIDEPAAPGQPARRRRSSGSSSTSAGAAARYDLALEAAPSCWLPFPLPRAVIIWAAVHPTTGHSHPISWRLRARLRIGRVAASPNSPGLRPLAAAEGDARARQRK
jgi:hypothetical protein